jgi:hypothetical protein
VRGAGGHASASTSGAISVTLQITFQLPCDLSALSAISVTLRSGEPDAVGLARIMSGDGARLTLYERTVDGPLPSSFAKVISRDTAGDLAPWRARICGHDAALEVVPVTGATERVRIESSNTDKC